MNGLIGKKLGMTQIFDADGRRVAVTVIAAGPCVVVQRKTTAVDGYEAVQLGFDPQRETRLRKSEVGAFKKAGVETCRIQREFACDADDSVAAGDTLSATLFEGTGYVDVVGTSKGRGFQGVVKRYNMGGGRMTHGGHSRRRPGSIGQCAYPGRVAKGQRMPGHMGNARITQQNLKLLDVRGDDNLLIVQGAVPGPNGGLVLVKKALKKTERSA
jgi:large subunit ribosomal protein L3